MDRREFLITSSGAAVAAASPATVQAEEKAPTSPAAPHYSGQAVRLRLASEVTSSGASTRR